jgi:Bacterial pre-peptidase C-terminal domain
MLGRMRRLGSAGQGVVAACCLLAGCRDRGGAPTLEGIDDQLAAVGQELVLELRASDPDGDAIDYGFDTEQASIRSNGSITRRPDGTGVFRWTPLGDDIGTWYVDFSASDGDHDDVVTVTIDVRSTLGQGAVPSFREPLGSGTTLDLQHSACAEFPVVIEDEDDTEVVIAIGGAGLPGAELVQESGLTAAFSWCPSNDQIADERHPLVLSADDDEHDPTLKDYLIVLRKAPKPDCPGAAPVVEHTPADLESVLAVEIAAQISDDVGLKQAPLLYWTYTAPELPVDFAAFDVLEMELASGDMTDGQWTATVDNPVAALPEGSSAAVWYVISAGDNDDTAGDCDHVTDAPTGDTFTLTVTNPGGGGGLGVCEPCSADVQCGGPDDLCVGLGATADTFCLTDCGSDDDCDADFECTPVESTDGMVAKQCVPRTGECGELPPPECSDDAFEDNDTRAQALGQSPLAAGEQDDLAACADDDDWYRVVVAGDTTIGALIDGGAASNLNVGLYDADGTAIAQAEGASSSEVVEECVEAGTYYVRVYAFGSADNTYDLLLATDAGACAMSCVDDDLEPDDTDTQATYAAVFPEPYETTDRMICSDDDDWYEIELYTDETVEVDLAFVDSAPDEDLDLHFHDEDGVDLTPCSEEAPGTCTAAQGQGTGSNEHYERTTVEAGCSPCTFYVRVHGWDGSENDYDLTIALQ